ncbi:MAG: hypothetical protein EBY26_07295, partial [Microbacteriaceae bacterium]|nr:hypothetical protein [Microbacteriaceae bacterium]
LLGRGEIEVSLVEAQEDGGGADRVGDLESCLRGIDGDGSAGGPVFVPPGVGVRCDGNEGRGGEKGCSDE